MNKEELNLIYDYTYSELSLLELSEKYNTIPYKIDKKIKKFLYTLNNMRRARLMKDTDQTTDITKSVIVKKEPSVQDIFFLHNTSADQNFLNKISSEKDQLTDYEYVYCYFLVYLNDDLLALEKAELTNGLSPDVSHSDYKRACNIRISYLNNKQNIIDQVLILKKKKLKTYDLSKYYVQDLILSQLASLKDTQVTSEKHLISKYIEMLGKTIDDTFNTKIQIEKLDPSKAISKLIELAKQDIDIELLEDGAEVDESWS